MTLHVQESLTIRRASTSHDVPGWQMKGILDPFIGSLQKLPGPLRHRPFPHKTRSHPGHEVHVAQASGQTRERELSNQACVLTDEKRKTQSAGLHRELVPLNFKLGQVGRLLIPELQTSGHDE